MKKKTFIFLIVMMIIFSATSCGNNNSDEEETSFTEALPHTDDILFSDTKDIIIDKEQLTPSEEDETWYSSDKKASMCDEEFSISYKFDSSNRIYYIIYSYVNANLDSNETAILLNKIRDFFDKRYGEHLYTLSWHINNSTNIDYKINMELSTDETAITITVENKSPDLNGDNSEIFDKERTEEEEAALEKECQESLIIYADMISEIQADIPEITVKYVVNTDTGGKEMCIYMPLLDSKDSTTYKMAELTTTKETLLNDNGITGITIFVQHNDKVEGIVMFENQNGRFEPVVNTL